MTSLPSPLNRRWRRIVVTVVVLVLGVLLIWPIESSRIDPRYAGVWMDRGGETWHFRLDGTFNLSDGPDRIIQQRWWVSGNRIVVFSPSGNKLMDARNWLTFTARRLGGDQSYCVAFDDYPVTKFDGDTMQLDYGLDLKRVPESTAAR